MMRDKLGLFGKDQNDKKLIDDLLSWMEINNADYTNTFCNLMNVNIEDKNVYEDQKFINWVKIWEKRISINNNLKEKSLDLMRNTNPTVIPRNHKVEEALLSANNGDMKDVIKLLEILKNPYNSEINIKNYQMPAPVSGDRYQTFCGT